MGKKILLVLIVLPYSISHAAAAQFEMETWAEPRAIQNIIPITLPPQNNFSIDSVTDLPSDELGTIPNSENTELIQEPARLAPSPFQGEGRSEGKIDKKTTTPHPNLLPKGEKELRPFKKNKPAQLLGKQNFSRANLSDLSAVYDGSKINLSAGVLEPDENAGGFLPKFQPDLLLPIKTLYDGLDDPMDIAIDGKNRLFVVNGKNHCVEIFDLSGKFLGNLGNGRRWKDKSYIKNPISVSVDAQNRVYVTDFDLHVVKIFDSDGKYLGTIGTGERTSGNDGFDYPKSAFADSKGHIYVGDTENNRVQVFDLSGKFLKTLETRNTKSEDEGANYFTNIFIDANDIVYVTDHSHHRIQIFDSDGKYLKTLGTRQKTSKNDGFSYPRGVFVDSKGRIYVADTDNHRVQIFDSSGKFLKTLGTGKIISFNPFVTNVADRNNGFNHPWSIASDAQGRIYVSDNGNHRVQVFANLDDIEAAEKKRREEAEKFLGKNPTIPEPSNKEPSARDRFKITWDDASRFLP